MTNNRFPKTARLLTSAEFSRAFGSQTHAADDCLVVVAATNDLGHPRLGLSISRKVGNAVVRNRWKRHIREAFRQQQSQIPANVDYVFRPRKGAVPTAAAIYRSVRKLAQKVARRLAS